MLSISDLIKLAVGFVIAAGVGIGAAYYANMLNSPEPLTENAYPIEVPEEGVAASGGGTDSAAADGASDSAAAVAAAPEPAPEPKDFATLLAEENVKDGKKVFNKCKACHTIDEGGPNRVGPNLWGVVMASQAHRDDFKYSDAMMNLGGTWTYEELDAYLTDPKKYAPGNRMAFAGVKDMEDRANLIAYLRSMSSDPAPLPTPGGDEAEAEEAEAGSESMMETAEEAAAEAAATAEEVAGDAVTAAEDAAGDAMTAAKDAAGDAMTAAEDAAGDAMTAAEETAGEAAEAVEEAASDAGAAMEEAAGDAMDAAEGMANEAADAAGNAADAAAETMNEVVDAANEAANDAMGTSDNMETVPDSQ